MKLYFLFITLMLFVQSTYADDFILKVIKEQKQICRNDLPTNCIKPVNVEGSIVKALEIKVLSTTKVSFITYDKKGKPVDLGKKFNLFIKATRIPARIDAEIVPVKLEARNVLDKKKGL